MSSSNRFLLSTLDDSFQCLDLSSYWSLFLIYLEAELNSTQLNSTQRRTNSLFQAYRNTSVWPEPSPEFWDTRPIFFLHKAEFPVMVMTDLLTCDRGTSWNDPWRLSSAIVAHRALFFTYTWFVPPPLMQQRTRVDALLVEQAGSNLPDQLFKRHDAFPYQTTYTIYLYHRQRPLHSAQDLH